MSHTDNIAYYVVDAETTGLVRPEPPASGVVEVGAIQIDPITLDVLGTGCSRVNPGCPIEPGASSIHGIYDKDVEDEDYLGQVWGVDGPIVMGGHNHKYDYAYLAPYCKDIRGGFCTVELSRKYLRGAPNNKLQTLADYYNLPRGKAHSALGDCETGLALLRLIVHESGLTLPELIESAKAPRLILVMPFGRHKGKSIHDLPLSYVSWFLEQDIERDLRHSLEQTMLLRGK